MSHSGLRAVDRPPGAYDWSRDALGALMKTVGARMPEARKGRRWAAAPMPSSDDRPEACMVATTIGTRRPGQADRPWAQLSATRSELIARRLQITRATQGRDLLIRGRRIASTRWSTWLCRVSSMSAMRSRWCSPSASSRIASGCVGRGQRDAVTDTGRWPRERAARAVRRWCAWLGPSTGRGAGGHLGDAHGVGGALVGRSLAAAGLFPRNGHGHPDLLLLRRDHLDAVAHAAGGMRQRR
jgi:hypothetical protein